MAKRLATLELMKRVLCELGSHPPREAAQLANQIALMLKRSRIDHRTAHLQAAHLINSHEALRDEARHLMLRIDNLSASVLAEWLTAPPDRCPWRVDRPTVHLKVRIKGRKRERQVVCGHCGRILLRNDEIGDIAWHYQDRRSVNGTYGRTVYLLEDGTTPVSVRAAHLSIVSAMRRIATTTVRWSTFLTPGEYL